MSGTIAVIAALPREIAALVRGRKADAAYLQREIAVHWVGTGDAVVVAAGMGAERATLAVNVAMDEVREMYSNPPDDEVELPSAVISVGLAGACSSGLRAGEIVIAREVVDTKTGERFETIDRDAKHVLASASGIASVIEKRRLYETYGASVVDMEAATVGRLARAHGIGFRAIKAVSDDAATELGELGRFATAQGQFRTTAFALYTALRPQTWGKTMRLGRDSKVALGALTKVLERELASDRG